MILQRNSYYNLFLFQGLNLPYVSFQKLIILYQIKKYSSKNKKALDLHPSFLIFCNCTF
ncbi:hypothetical protein LEP1GSC083_0927 [Leptospira interrogans serovar Pyrogenes str. L0374]|uniref:Uncharacterized protein n=1 Tax=Leptospira interrogans serovar Pyrogenes str. L0374 TaxID=1049928 RepID=M6KUS7_LEPIR|nr:hypothetical protein LEP1GSC083_0927 [Leptospira interrogans serovar Pyrogenes str. L0374]EMN78574.1 hypothetical protein LEP1GSC106_3145 [Leptospira interrogans serovar Grippotyphosa str. UI 12764]